MAKAILDEPENQHETERQLCVRSYLAPRLHVYGPMTRLTAGGSGHASENNQGGQPKKP